MPKEPNLNELMDTLAETRTVIRALQEQEKILKLRQNDLESDIIWKMDQQGLDQIANDVCTISKKIENVPTVEDCPTLYKHISDTGRFELLQKRVAARAYREILQMEPSVPGVKSTELTKINYRSK